MKKTRNIFFGDGSYQLNSFTLSFSTQSIQSNFLSFYFKEARFSIHILTIFKFFQLLCIYFLQKCFDEQSSQCRHTNYFLFSFLSLILIVLGENINYKYDFLTFLNKRLFCVIVNNFIYINYYEYFGEIFCLVYMIVDMLVLDTIYFSSIFLHVIFSFIDVFFSSLFLNFYDFYLFSRLKADFLPFIGLFMISVIIYIIREIMIKNFWRSSNTFKKSYEQWKILFQDLQIPCFLLNKKFDILSLNPKALTFLNKYGQKNNLNIFYLSNDEDLEKLSGMKEECFLKAQVLTKKFNLISNDQKKEKIFDISLSPVLNLLYISFNKRIIFRFFGTMR